jgi:hypothetical protein
MTPHSLKPYKKDLVDVLNELRFDKIKPVRDSSLDALNSLKDVPDMEVIELKKQNTNKNAKEE